MTKNNVVDDKKGWERVWDYLKWMGYTPYEYLVFGHIQRVCGWKNGDCYTGYCNQSFSAMGIEIGISASAVKRAIKRPLEDGLIVMQKRKLGDTNVYRLNKDAIDAKYNEWLDLTTR